MASIAYVSCGLIVRHLHFYRLSTSQAADRIVVMDGGQIVEVILLPIKFKLLTVFMEIIACLLFYYVHFLLKTEANQPPITPLKRSINP